MAKNIGGIWEKEKNGNKYLSISIEVDGQKRSFVAFKNEYKQAGDNKPNYSIMPPRDQQEQKREPEPEQPVDEGEIPF